MRLHPRNPRRPTDWRWQWAHLLLDGVVRPSRRRDDGAVDEAARFLKALRRCHEDADREALEMQWPDLSAAHAIYSEEPHRRWAVEARLLSGETREIIATKHDVSKGAVVAFERVFFDVIAHLARADYVLFSAIGIDPGSSHMGLGVAWKWFGFVGGPVVVDYVLGAHKEGGEPARHDQADCFVLDHLRDELLVKVAVAALTLKVDGRAAMKQVGLLLRILDGERCDRESAPTLEPITPNITAMWEGLTSSVGGGGSSGR